MAMLIYYIDIILLLITFSGEPKTSTDTPKWTDNSVDSGTNNNNAYSTIGGMRSLYVLVGAVISIVGAIVLLIFVTICIYSKRSSAHSTSPGKCCY